MIDMVALKSELKRDEGVKFKPYIDSVGKVTVGCGRNIQDVGISTDEMELMLSNDINRAISDLNRVLPWWGNLDPIRQRVMVNMCFNMGIGNGKKGLTSFVNTLAMIQKGKYSDAAKAMRQSKWYTQVGQRAERLCIMMETGRA